MEKHGNYEYDIIVFHGKYSYLIMSKEVKGRVKVYSNEWFEEKSKAYFAAIGHIQLLEQGVN
jgi:hypothetical protein